MGRSPHSPPAPLSTYEGIAPDVAEGLEAENIDLAADGSEASIDENDGECRLSIPAWASEDLLENGGSVPDAERLVAAANPVLAQHDFGDLEESESDQPLPMRTFVADDDGGGEIRLVVESRPKHPTVELRVRVTVDAGDSPCDDSLLE